jgi:two-component system sensor histidine kinase UhpB
VKRTAGLANQDPWARAHNEYLSVLKEYLDGAGEAALQRAYEIGRAALGAGIGVIELGRIHHAALEELLLCENSPEEAKRKLQAAADFFAEIISPFEMAYRGFHEASLALRHFNDMLEQEAKRIAHALHDEAGQLLVAVYIALEEMSWKHPRAKAQIGKVKGLLDKIEEQLRHLSHELRPAILDDLGLVPALHYLAEGIFQRAGLLVTIESSRWVRCPASTESALYRVVQEALNNISRHARAARVWVTLEHEMQSVRCSVRDDGIGFEVKAVQARDGEHGFGLMGIRERVSILGGSVQVNSGQGQGTEVVVTLPLEH